MLKYDIDEFREWVLRQPHGRTVADFVDMEVLHTICLNFTEEYENEQIREEIRYEERQRAERTASQAAREATAHRNTVDAVVSEQSAAEAGPENLRHGIASDVK